MFNFLDCSRLHQSRPTPGQYFMQIPVSDGVIQTVHLEAAEETLHRPWHS